jgi:hypothetical protein
LNVYDGLLCDSTSQVRRVVFYNYKPDIFDNMPMRIYQWDDSIVGSMDNVTKLAYLNNASTYTDLPFRKMMTPLNSWAFPVVTGKKYRIHWQQGLDFTRMQVDLGSTWVPTD